MSKKDPRVLLVYPPNQLMDIEIPRPDGSLGPLYLAGALRARGIEVDLLDASVGTIGDSLRETFFRRTLQPNGLTRIGMTPNRIREHVASGGYDIVGINSNFTPQTRMVLEVARIVKNVAPKTLVAVGGVNGRALTGRILGSGAVDLVALTEGEKTIVELVQAFQKSSVPSDANGIAFLLGETVVTKPAAPDAVMRDLDLLPLPAWDLLPFGKYDEINSPHGSITPGKRRRYAPIMTSRGCPFRCAYCHISEEKDPRSPGGDIGTLRFKSIDRVMREVEILRALGVTHLYIEDDSLLAKKARVIDFFGRLTGMGMKVSDVNGVNLVHLGIHGADGKLHPDREYLEVMKAAGFDEIVFPVESASQRVLDTYATGKLNLERFNVLELVRVAVDIGITCPINMMIGFPDETEREMRESIEFAKRLVQAGAPYVTFFIPIPFPGSKLYAQAIAGGHLSPDFDPDAMNWKNAVMQHTVVPPERVVELRNEAWEAVNTDAYKRTRIEREIRSRVATETKTDS